MLVVIQTPIRPLPNWLWAIQQQLPTHSNWQEVLRLAWRTKSWGHWRIFLPTRGGGDFKPAGQRGQGRCWRTAQNQGRKGQNERPAKTVMPGVGETPS
jgi:hypothetical protein